MSYGENEDEIMMGLRNQTVKIYEPKFKAFAECIETKAGEGPLVGITRFDGAILTAVESGTVKFWRYKEPFSFDPIDTEVNNSGKLKNPNNEWENEEEKLSHASELKAGRLLTRMRQDKTEKNIIATGGKENDLQVWDLNSPKEPVFRAKNVAADQLEWEEKGEMEACTAIAAGTDENQVIVGSSQGKWRRARPLLRGRMRIR